MVQQAHLYDHFANLLSQPQEDIRDAARRCHEALRGRPEYPAEVAAEIKAFEDEIAGVSLDDLQGVYSYTFELTADHTLDLGFYLFDGFKRTNTLVAIKQMYKENGFPYDSIAQGELPDNLVVVLRFLAGLKDEDLKREFRENFLIKALEKLGKNFENNRQNVYRHVIKALWTVIDKDIKAGA